MSDWMKAIQESKEEGREEGREEGALEQTFTLLERTMKNHNYSVAMAMNHLSLTEEERESLESEYDLEDIEDYDFQ